MDPAGNERQSDEASLSGSGGPVVARERWAGADNASVLRAVREALERGRDWCEILREWSAPGADLPGVHLSYADLRGCRLVGCDLSDASPTP
ncbi:pentapeptide repeat-containing protein [Streptomyces liangshanensis]|uniref:pentapeptide repeat-containing protein n=1 Tax=Streptomyces liangshanensis TaxID=2717324 RepID=UPI0036DE3285